MENTLTLYVRYLAKPGCRETFLRQLTTHGIIDAIRREDGCLRYDYFLSVQNADEILRQEVGAVFAKVLEHAGVYKCNEQGREAFLRFIASV